MEKLLVNIIDYWDVEKIIRNAYGFDDPKEAFSIVAMEEWNNDTDHLFHLETKPLDKWQQKDLDKWKADPVGFHQYILYPILQDMVNNGHLEPGPYLIRVCW